MRKNLLLLVSAIFVLSGCPSGAGTNTTNLTPTSGNNTNISANTINTNSNTNQGRENTGANTVSPVGDNEFMMKAAQGGMAEVSLGNLASTRGQSADVKGFGKKMIEDHGKANTELKELAQKKGLTLPTALSAEQKKMSDDLSKLSGAEFDRKYVDEMVKDHEKDVALFDAQSRNAADADIKAFAAKTLPTLRMHLQMIKDIQAKMK